MANDLTAFNLSEPIFVDANIFIEYLPDQPHAVSCQYFLKQIENRAIRAVTSVSCINEALYTALIIIGTLILKPSVKDKKKKVREEIERNGDFAKTCYTEVKIFLDYLLYLQNAGMVIMDYLLEHQTETINLAITNSLSFNFTDATYLHICRDQGIKHIATADGNFEKNPFAFEIWKP